MQQVRCYFWNEISFYSIIHKMLPLNFQMWLEFSMPWSLLRLLWLLLVRKKSSVFPYLMAGEIFCYLIVSMYCDGFTNFHCWEFYGVMFCLLMFHAVLHVQFVSLGHQTRMFSQFMTMVYRIMWYLFLHMWKLASTKVYLNWTWISIVA